MSRYAELAETLYDHGKAASDIKTAVIDGKTFATSKLVQVHPDARPPAPEQATTINVKSLTALGDLIKVRVDAIDLAACVLKIDNHLKVHLVAKNTDEWGRYRVFATAAAEPCRFEFGKYHPHEDFCIALQQHFVPIDGLNGDFGYLARVSQTITAESTTISENDGISQSVGLKKSIKSGLQSKEDLRRVVSLAPYRTFIEVPQPVSDFLFRAKDQGEGKIPALGLFECDGGKYSRLAMDSIKAFLEELKTEVPVIC